MEDTGMNYVSIELMSTATRNNVSYQDQIIQKNFSQNNPTLWNNVLTEFPEKVIEESYPAKPKPFNE
jgi:hypothetical protein